MAETERTFGIQETPQYSVKGYLPRDGEWLSAKVYVDKNRGLFAEVSLQFLAVRYAVAEGAGNRQPVKYIYFKDGGGKGFVLPEEDILYVGPAKLAPVLRRHLRSREAA